MRRSAVIAIVLSALVGSKALACVCSSSFWGIQPMSLLYHEGRLVFLAPKGYWVDEYSTKKPELSKALWVFNPSNKVLERVEPTNAPPGVRKIVKIGTSLYIGGFGGLAVCSSKSLDDLQTIPFFNKHVVNSIVSGGESVWVGTDKGLFELVGNSVSRGFVGVDSAGAFNSFSALVRGTKLSPILSDSHIMVATVIGDLLFASTIRRSPDTSCGGACSDRVNSAGLEVVDLKTQSVFSVAVPNETIPIEILASSNPDTFDLILEDFNRPRRSVRTLDMRTRRLTSEPAKPWEENSLEGFVSRWIKSNSDTPAAESDALAFLEEYSRQDSQSWRLRLARDTVKLLAKRGPERIFALYDRGTDEARRAIIERLGSQKTPIAARLMVKAVDRKDYFGQTLPRILERRSGPESIELLKRIVREGGAAAPPDSRNFPYPSSAGEALAALKRMGVNDANSVAVEAAYNPKTSPRVKQSLEDNMRPSPQMDVETMGLVLQRGDSAARFKVLQFHKSCSERNPVVHAGMLACLDDPNPSVRARAATCAGHQFLRSEAPAVIAKLRPMLKDKEPEARAGAVRGLSNFYWSDMTDDMLLMLKDSSAEVRMHAAHYLGQHPSKRVVGPLIEALKDPDVQVRQWAAQSLGLTRDPEGLEPLKALLSDSNENVRDRAQNGIRMIELRPKSQ